MAASLIFCGHCGVQNPQSGSFCFSCGYALSASAVAAPASSTNTGQLSARVLLKQRYRVLQTIGQGGMGAVYLAQDTQLGDRPLAVKEMSQNDGQQAQEAIESFKREAHLLASLQHPNLPSIYDHFEDGGRWYLVMSFIQGETLEDYLERLQNHKLPLEETLRIGEVLCDVLNYLHTHQPPIIFRDLKPGNIMRSTNGHFYLIDFGIARHFKPGQAKDTANYGSAGYAPPEQYGKAQTTAHSDIYSLGATLYECLSGYDPSQSPFRFPPLQSLVPTLPEQLVMLITQMLDLDESKRPASITVVQQELQQVSTPAPSLAKQTALPHPIQPVPVQQGQTAAHMIICGHCWAENCVNKNFCFACGYALSAYPSPTQPIPPRAVHPRPIPKPKQAPPARLTAPAPAQGGQIHTAPQQAANSAAVPPQQPPIKQILSATKQGPPVIRGIVIVIKRTLFAIIQAVGKTFLFTGMTMGLVISALSALVAIIGSFAGRSEAFVDLSIGGMFCFFGLMLFFIVRIPRVSKKVFPMPIKIATTMRKLTWTIAIIFGVTVSIIGIVTNTPNNENGAGVPAGVLSVLEGIVIWWVTRIRTKKTL